MGTYSTIVSANLQRYESADMTVYNVAKGVEKLSVLLGLGQFEVQPNWQCPSCASSPSEPLCDDCRTSWIHELKDLDYSDAYEARLSRKLGVAGLVMGLSGWASNVGLGWFEFGDMLGGLTESVLGTHTIISGPPYLSRYLRSSYSASRHWHFYQS